MSTDLEQAWRLTGLHCAAAVACTRALPLTDALGPDLLRSLGALRAARSFILVEHEADGSVFERSLGLVGAGRRIV